MWRWMRQKWAARRRRIDMQILWPSCVSLARDLDHARAAFAVHAFSDPAWTDFYSEEELKQFIDDLEAGT